MSRSRTWYMIILAAPDALSIITGELLLLAACQLQHFIVGFSFKTAFNIVIFYSPVLGSKNIWSKRGFRYCSCIFQMICELPWKCAFVKLHDAVHQANELDSPPLVPGNVEPVYVGLRTETPQLEIHLPGVLARAGQHCGDGAGVLPPATKVQNHETTVIFGIILHVESQQNIKILEIMHMDIWLYVFM